MFDGDVFVLVLVVGCRWHLAANVKADLEADDALFGQSQSWSMITEILVGGQKGQGGVRMPFFSIYESQMVRLFSGHVK
jgi:hypothetical protein